VNLVQGNALHIPLADKSVQCVITSPPYWGLRSYAGTATWEGGDPECDHMEYEKPRRDHNGRDFGDTRGLEPARIGASIPYRDTCRKCGARRIDAQLGSEPLHDCGGWATGADCGLCYICHMRQVARECWRVLRDDGVMFWNIADSMYSQTKGSGGPTPKQASNAGSFYEPMRFDVPGLKPKDKCGIPERTALAFQADGWWWRSDIIWHKPNPMPESVTDRPTKSHEFIYLFTKAERYAWDAEAVREPQEMSTILRAQYARNQWKYAKEITDINVAPQIGPNRIELNGRNLRDVWTMATQAYPGAHFATYPSELPRRCIKAGTSERGCCPKCGKGWVRVVEKQQPPASVYTGKVKPDSIAAVSHPELGKVGMGQKLQDWYELHPSTTLGFRPACTCDAGEPVPCIVLDPFSGAATTGLVARELGRHYVGLELSGEYLKQSRDRLSLTALDEWANNSGKKDGASVADLPLFGGLE
jgi:DNA modification methylase